MTELPEDRATRLTPKLRRHFGEKFGAEPTIVFCPDGKVIVRVDGQRIDITKQEADAFDD